MKHHIVIESGGIVLENMMSNISSPKELRLRLSKKWHGKRRIYFRAYDPHYGLFYVDGDIYFWLIDPEDKYFCKRKPVPYPETHLFRNSTLNRSFHLYENDIISLPNFDEINVFQHRINNNICMYLVKCILNGQPYFISLSDLGHVLSENTSINALKKAAGKTIRITQAIRCSTRLEVVARGLLTGRPIEWRVVSTKYPSISYKYVIL